MDERIIVGMMSNIPTTVILIIGIIIGLIQLYKYLKPNKMAHTDNNVTVEDIIGASTSSIVIDEGYKQLVIRNNIREVLGITSKYIVYDENRIMYEGEDLGLALMEYNNI